MLWTCSQDAVEIACPAAVVAYSGTSLKGGDAHCMTLTGQGFLPSSIYTP